MQTVGIQIAEAKAPWVMFETRADEDRAASIREGRYATKDVDYVLITPHGSRDQIERVASEWFESLGEEVKQGRFPQAWLKAYKDAYADWKAGREIPLSGTPIRNWPLLSPSQVNLLTDLKVLTVEVLAGANEELIKRLGMGGRALVDKAKAYLDAAAGPGKLAEQVTAVSMQLEALTNINRELVAKNELLTQQLQNLAPQQATALATTGDGQPDAIAAGELLDNAPGAGLRKL